MFKDSFCAKMLEAVETFEGHCCAQPAIERVNQPTISGRLFLSAPSPPPGSRLGCRLVMTLADFHLLYVRVLV